MGFPRTIREPYGENLKRFLNTWFNNCGDPFGPEAYSSYPTMQMEKEIIYYFAHLMNLPREETWGHFGSSSSECILYALY